MKRLVICSPLYRLSKQDTLETRVVNDFANLLSTKYEVIIIKPTPIYSGIEGLLRRYFKWLLQLINGSIDLSSRDTSTLLIDGLKVYRIPYKKYLTRFIGNKDSNIIAEMIAVQKPDAVVFHWTLPSLFIAEVLQQKHGIRSSLVIHELNPIKYLLRFGVTAKRLAVFKKIATRNEQIKFKVEKYVEVTNVLYSYFESD